MPILSPRHSLRQVSTPSTRVPRSSPGSRAERRAKKSPTQPGDGSLHRPERPRSSPGATLRSACAVRSAPPPRALQGRPYDGEVAFTDAQIGRVLETLKPPATSRHRGDGAGRPREVWAITARPPPVLTYQSTMRVPFIVSGRGVPAARRIASRVATTMSSRRLSGARGRGGVARCSGVIYAADERP